MNNYTMPPDMSEKEKIIGGILNINQFFWVLGGLGIGAIIFTLLFDLIGGKAALVFGLIGATSGLPFALYKKNELTLFQYITFKQKFKRKVHKLPNRRKDVL
ncbi:PrgI family mobile element protein [Psychrobacillus sp. FSL H8-0510]